MEGVGKLIELLNEYEKELNTGLHWRIDEKYGMLWRGLNLMGVDQYLISKHYGFIKWLVDNDKIDLNKVKREFYNNICITEYGDEDRAMGDDNLVIAVLAIQDSPIDFLCSILK